MVIKRVEPVSFAKVMGTIYALLGLILGLLVAALGSMAGGGFGSAMPFAGIGIAVVIVLPIVYGLIGFVFCLIGAAIYNLVAGWVGGVEIQTD